jgi:hypothetical protein
MYVLMHNRKQRFERVTRELKVTRVLSTLVEEMKAIGIVTAGGGDAQSQCTDVMAPVAHSERSPVLLPAADGRRDGAGKSTVLKEIEQEAFWANAEGNAVVVEEADAFEETDVVYRAISSMGHHNDMLQTAELVCTVTYTPCTTALHALFSRRRRQLALLHGTSTTCIIVSFLN